jgi:hypothetical protein
LLRVPFQPDNPDTHFFPATTYPRIGRAADAAREFAAHESLLAKLDAGGDQWSSGAAACCSSALSGRGPVQLLRLSGPRPKGADLKHDSLKSGDVCETE